MNKKELKEILNEHKLWLNDDENGKKADLRRANLRGADLREANLREADLDLSVFPLSCRSFDIIADDRLVLQLFCHISRLNITYCSKNVKKIIDDLPKLAKNGFCEYRNDVKEI